MLNLLSTNFSRLKKNSPFIFSVVFMVVYVVAVIIYAVNQKFLGSEIAFETLFMNGYGLGGMIAFPGMLLSIVCGIFIGTDFSDGTLRNKLIVGKSREKIYLANYITCVAIGIILNLIYVTVISVIGIPWLGGIEMPIQSFIDIVLDGAFAEEIVPNSKYLSDGAKRIVQVIIDILPSGQSIQLSHLTAPNIQYMWLYSVGVIGVTNFVGISVFKKADLK